MASHISSTDPKLNGDAAIQAIVTNPYNGGLFKDEYFWCDHQQWLQSQGYLLRPRYRKDWVPSWHGTKKWFRACEDGRALMQTNVLDAIRTSDGCIVAIKRIRRSRNPDEIGIAQWLSSEYPSSDQRNRSVPVYDVLQSPIEENIVFLIMPYLIPWDRKGFATVGEGVECIRQLLEGLLFMHESHIAHGDVTSLNVMMDPLPVYSEIPHPIFKSRAYKDFGRRVKWYGRKGRPVRYYYTDFGLSRRFSADESVPLVPLVVGGDKSVPEYQHPTLSNPYKIDIYCLGNLIREDFIHRSTSYDFLTSLVNDMVQDDPVERPSVAEAWTRFEQVQSSLSKWTLYSRDVNRDEFVLATPVRALFHLVSVTTYFVSHHSAFYRR